MSEIDSKNLNLPWSLRKNNGNPVTVAVVGDLILDEYLDGSVDRISPEAPVPVHLVKNTSHTAGGAANAARNIRLAGGQALLFSVTGHDESYKTLCNILTDDGMSCDGILAVSDRTTIRKTRITSNSHQIVRIDWERVVPITEEQQDQLLDKMKKVAFDGLLVSDYGKGALPERFVKKAIELAQVRGVPIVVDPKGKDFSRYQGASVVTPNLKEASEALELSASSSDGEVLGRALQRKFNLGDILVTMSGKGMILVRQDGAPSIYRKPEAKEVYDVSGAGDTVAAIVALALATGTSPDTAIDLANLAAGRVVEKWGTQPIYEDELIEALANKIIPESQKKSQEKILDLDRLVRVLDNNVLIKKDVVFTNGCFDILHAGHLSYLEKAKAKGDVLVVGLNSDQSISRIKGPSRPIVEQEHRAALLAGLACVDYVVIFDDDTPEKLIKAIRPNILIKGADWSIEKIAGGDFVLQRGGRVETIELVPGLSTSEIIRRAQSR